MSDASATPLQEAHVEPRAELAKEDVDLQQAQRFKFCSKPNTKSGSLGPLASGGALPLTQVLPPRKVAFECLCHRSCGNTPACSSKMTHSLGL